MSETKVIKLKNSSGAELEILNYGATIIGLNIPDKNNNPVNVVVSLENEIDYVNEAHPCLGSSIGRYAGRISRGKFLLNGIEYPLYNEEGVHLHGGKIGFDKKYWEIEQVSDSKVVLSIESKDMEEGYPGNLKASVTYELTEQNEVKISYSALTDKATPVNLTNHAYYNLEGEGDVLNHKLLINSTNTLEVSPQLLPSGKLIPTKDNRFDRTDLEVIGREDFVGFDDAFVLAKEESKAVLISNKTGIKMEVFTNQPACVVYTPVELGDLPIKNNAKYNKFSSICFETQNFPDAPNNENFPSSILKPGKVYVNESIFKFSIV